MAYVSSLIDQLGLRLEDAGEKTFPATTKLIALNNSQLRVATSIENEYLTELQVLEVSKSLTTGYFNLASLANKVLKGAEGILGVGITGGKPATRIVLDDRRKLDNSFLAATAQNPVYYIFQNKIYFLPATTAAIDIHYLKVPTTMYYKFTANSGGTFSSTRWDGASGQGLSLSNDAYNGAVVWCPEKQEAFIVTDYVASGCVFTLSPATALPAGSATFAVTDTLYFLSNPFYLTNIAGVMCDLNDALINALLGYAEFECWLSDAQRDRATTAERAANEIIALLNGRYVKAEGIGTKGDNRREGR